MARPSQLPSPSAQPGARPSRGFPLLSFLGWRAAQPSPPRSPPRLGPAGARPSCPSAPLASLPCTACGRLEPPPPPPLVGPTRRPTPSLNRLSLSPLPLVHVSLSPMQLVPPPRPPRRRPGPPSTPSSSPAVSLSPSSPSPPLLPRPRPPWRGHGARPPHVACPGLGVARPRRPSARRARPHPRPPHPAWHARPRPPRRARLPRCAGPSALPRSARWSRRARPTQPRRARPGSLAWRGAAAPVSPPLPAEAFLGLPAPPRATRLAPSAAPLFAWSGSVSRSPARSRAAPLPCSRRAARCARGSAPVWLVRDAFVRPCTRACSRGAPGALAWLAVLSARRVAPRPAPRRARLPLDVPVYPPCIICAWNVSFILCSCPST
jgi:hypothetical protein